MQHHDLRVALLIGWMRDASPSVSQKIRAAPGRVSNRWLALSPRFLHTIPTPWDPANLRSLTRTGDPRH